MRSRNRAISASKAVNLGAMPTFVQLVHKHFEKECPSEVTIHGQSAEFAAPLDLLRMSITDKALVEEVESVTFAYAKHTH